jgi:hypothetical protein
MLRVLRRLSFFFRSLGLLQDSGKISNRRVLSVDCKTNTNGL